MERDSFVVYKSFLSAIKRLKRRDIQGELALAIIEYGITGVMTECGEIVELAMELIKPQIEANNQKYLNGKKGAEHGKKGGRPKKETPEKPQENPNETPNEDVNDNVNVNDISFLEKKKQKTYTSDEGKILENSEKENPTPDLKTEDEKRQTEGVVALTEINKHKKFSENGNEIYTEYTEISHGNGSNFNEDAKSGQIHTQEEKTQKIKEKRFDFCKALLDAGFDPELSAEWLKIRKAKKAVNSELAFKNFLREVEKSGRSPNEVLALVVQKQWKGFEASWLHNEQFTTNNGQKSNTTGNYTRANAGGGYPTGQKISARAFLAKQYSEQLARNSEAGNITIEVETSPTE